MPRRRMLDPSFTEDIEVAQLTRDERLFLIGCLRNADDDGRLRGNPAFLKAEIFMYDNDIDLTQMTAIKESTLKKMSSWHAGNIWRLADYLNGNQEFICFPNWAEMEKPSHPTPSKLPAPPPEIMQLSPETSKSLASASPELLPKTARDTPPQSSLGQSSLDKVSIGKSSAVPEDFTKFLNSEKDLTDFLTTTLEKYLPLGLAWVTEVLQRLWTQALGERLKGPPLDVTLAAVKKYPLSVLAVAYAKAVKYKGGKYSTAKYLEKILTEKAGERERNRSP